MNQSLISVLTQMTMFTGHAYHVCPAASESLQRLAVPKAGARGTMQSSSPRAPRRSGFDESAPAWPVSVLLALLSAQTCLPIQGVSDAQASESAHSGQVLLVELHGQVLQQGVEDEEALVIVRLAGYQLLEDPKHALPPLEHVSVGVRLSDHRRLVNL